ncbi:Coatomer subunit zeta-2 [Wickerhamomyces ciferrii]|uniref:Coatomer subunit zeta n=1 Tax=Wickerhamomyces ciferrii (strain ATCC 14091 / BCRC 22168 / CBS 111 / JCM 3599 / NBRC 0793 / NRRL Y-1031 F-60-10) TaxID=1206466 RepID=K0KRE8_WICCF|nr:Coatomer subunit zeta-2 [Wickerhamomyces ciferrii]CCH43888.1 Coatomer subunit zeta-2 [Wickerhamomyces ciferrii]
MSKNLSLYAVDAFLILDNEGKRLYAKYYKAPHKTEQEFEASQFATLKSQKAFEKSLFAKSYKQNADIILFEDHIVVYKEVSDVVIYLISGLDENESILFQTLEGFKDGLDKVLNYQLDKKTIQENFDKVSIAADETIDDGIILETESSVIAARTSKAPTNEPSLKNIDLSEKGLFNAFNFARGKLAERIQQGL